MQCFLAMLDELHKMKCTVHSLLKGANNRRNDRTIEKRTNFETIHYNYRDIDEIARLLFMNDDSEWWMKNLFNA
jgi:hypothetical protein